MVARAFAVVVAVLLAAVAHAQDVRLKLDTTQLQEGQRAGFDVVLEGARPRSVPEVKVDDAGLAVAYVGQTQQTSIVNGRMQQYVRFRYELVARRQGSWRLGPAYVKVDDVDDKTRTLTATPVDVVVGAPTTSSRGTGDLEATAEFDAATAWQGEVVVYHAALRSRRQITAAGWFGAPEAGLLVPKDARPEHKDYVVRDARGDVLVDEAWQPFVVTGTGHLAWPAPVLQAEVMEEGGFGFLRRTKTENVPAQPLSLDSRPLPPAPPGFSGLVGDYTLAARLERTRAKVGDSIEWLVAIDGDGALDGFELDAPKDVDGFRVYEAASRLRTQVRQGHYQAGVTFQRTLVPTREGVFPLPAVSVIAFSPSRGEYVTLTTQPVTLTVEPGEGHGVDVQSFGGPEAEAPPEVADDVRPLRTSGPGLRLPWEAWFPVALVLAAVPAVGIGTTAVGEALVAAWRRRRRAEQRAATPLERLAHLPTDPEARLVALDAALRLALARATGVDVAALDRATALASLDSDVAGEAGLVSRLLDRARFAGTAPPADLEARLRAVVEALEGEAA